VLCEFLGAFAGLLLEQLSLKFRLESWHFVELITVLVVDDEKHLLGPVVRPHELIEFGDIEVVFVLRPRSVHLHG
jgi:hypothetical protein